MKARTSQTSNDRAAIDLRQRLADLVCLGKPRITAMVVVTALGGMLLALRSGAVVGLDPVRSVVGIAGIALVVIGANAFNMFLERDSDALMERTANRPLPTGRMNPTVALIFGAVASVSSLVLLATFVDMLTAFLSALSLVLYVLVYTPLKRVSTVALLVGAIPGAMPPLLGWTAATGEIELPGLMLFAVLYFWQLPHFLAISVFRSREYARAGIKIMPVEHGLKSTRGHAIAYTVALVAASLALYPLGIANLTYALVAGLLGAVFLGLSVFGFDSQDPNRWARRMFFGSLVYLTVLFAAIAVV